MPLPTLKPNTDPFVAIDFGSTNSVAYLYKNGNPEQLRDGNDQHARGFPSVVQYSVDTQGNQVVYTGSIVKKKLTQGNAPFVVKCVKRIIGLSYEEFEKLDNRDMFGCEVFEKDGKPYFKTSENDTVGKSGEEVASEIFKAIKVEADKRLDNKKERLDCYITVPANYKDHQREAIKTAAAMAGFDVVAIFAEPTSAAMSWCCDVDNLAKLKKDDKMLVFDFGGGTLDISVIRYNGDVFFEVLTTGGNPRLGGEDIDTQIAQSILNDGSINLKKAAHPGGKKYPTFVSMCEEAKISLATTDSTTIYLDDFIGNDDHDDDDGEYKLTSERLDSLVKSSLEKKIKDCVNEILKHDVSNGNIRLSTGVIRHIFMVGGSSQLKAVQSIVRSMFALSSQTIHDDVNPETAVAEGAMNLAIKLRGGRPNDIKECVNYSYGLLSGSDQVAILLHKNSSIPSSGASVCFQTSTDFPELIESEIYQWDENTRSTHGERTEVVPKSECTRVKKYKFKNPSPKSKGEQRFEITFKIEYGGTLQVICRDMDTQEILNDQSFKGIIHRE